MFTVKKEVIEEDVQYEAYEWEVKEELEEGISEDSKGNEEEELPSVTLLNPPIAPQVEQMVNTSATVKEEVIDMGYDAVKEEMKDCKDINDFIICSCEGLPSVVLASEYPLASSSQSVTFDTGPHRSLELKEEPEFNEGQVMEGYVSYECPESGCEYQTLCEDELASHIISNHPTDNEKPFKCPQCPYRSSFKWRLKTHIQSVHLKLKCFSCSQCAYQAMTKKCLNRHEQAVHSTEKPFICSKCPYRSSVKRNLKRHDLNIHSTVKPFSCMQCPYKTSSECSLKSHEVSVHSTEKRFSCLKCPHQTSSKCKLERHQLKCMVCSDCSYHTTRKNHFEAHKRSAHSVLSCTQCSFVTTKQGELKKHARSVHKIIHSLMDRRFSCLVCPDYCTTTQENLNCHMLAVHYS